MTTRSATIKPRLSNAYGPVRAKRSASAAAKAITSPPTPPPVETKPAVEYLDISKPTKFSTVQVVRAENPNITVQDRDFGPLRTPAGVVLVTGADGHAPGRAILRCTDVYGQNASCWIPLAARFILVPKEEADALLKAAEASREVRQARYHNFVGCDPEFFVVDAKGTLIPSFEFLPSKANAASGVYWDGYQAEFDTTATTCLNEQMGIIRQRLATAVAMMPKGSRITLQNVFDIPDSRLESDSQEHTAFGCSPSLNAYGEMPPLPEGVTVKFRSAGGHMHFTLPKVADEKKENYARDVVKNLDAILGVIGVAMYQYWDGPRRRQYYGRAGEYRLTTYGVEYRTPSNAWLSHPSAFHFNYELARRVIGLTVGPAAGVLPYPPSGNFMKQWWGNTSEEEVRNAINNSDVALALQILEKNHDLFTSLMKTMPGNTDTEATQRMIYSGFHTLLKNPDTPSSAWGISSGGYGSCYSCGSLLKFLASKSAID